MDDQMEEKMERIGKGDGGDLRDQQKEEEIYEQMEKKIEDSWREEKMKQKMDQ